MLEGATLEGAPMALVVEPMALEVVPMAVEVVHVVLEAKHLVLGAVEDAIEWTIETARWKKHWW